MLHPRSAAPPQEADWLRASAYGVYELLAVASDDAGQSSLRPFELLVPLMEALARGSDAHFFLLAEALERVRRRRLLTLLQLLGPGDGRACCARACCSRCSRPAPGPRRLPTPPRAQLGRHEAGPARPPPTRPPACWRPQVTAQHGRASEEAKVALQQLLRAAVLRYGRVSDSVVAGVLAEKARLDAYLGRYNLPEQ
jgi:hypothetical protein